MSECACQHEAALRRLVDDLELVLHTDWAYSEEMLADSWMRLALVGLHGTFLWPEVDDEDNNWANRGGLLASYRSALLALGLPVTNPEDRVCEPIRLDVGGEPPYFPPRQKPKAAPLPDNAHAKGPYKTPWGWLRGVVGYGASATTQPVAGTAAPKTATVKKRRNKKRGRGPVFKYPFKELAVGESFLVPKERANGSIPSLAVYHSGNLGKKFRAVKENGGYRVTRLE